MQQSDDPAAIGPLVTMAKKPSAPPPAYTWNIYRLRGTPAQYLGHVEAVDEAEAIRKAVEQFKIEPAQRDRLIVQRTA